MQSLICALEISLFIQTVTSLLKTTQRMARKTRWGNQWMTNALSGEVPALPAPSLSWIDNKVKPDIPREWDRPKLLIPLINALKVSILRLESVVADSPSWAKTPRSSPPSLTLEVKSPAMVVKIAFSSNGMKAKHSTKTRDLLASPWTSVISM